MRIVSTRRLAGSIVASALVTLAGGTAQAVTLVNTSTYTQDFNGLATTGTANSAATIGWLISETGGGARDNELYGADTGNSDTGDTYSYGLAGNSDRALGSLASGSLISTFGAAFTNDIGSTITDLAISFVGEQWRRGSAAANTLTFAYSTNATSLTTGTYTTVSALSFTGVSTGAINSLRNGNLAVNQAARAATIGGLNIADGQTVYIRWSDVNDAGSDDGLAIDSFSLTPTIAAVAAVPEPTTWAMLISGFAMVGAGMRRRTRTMARVTA